MGIFTSRICIAVAKRQNSAMVVDNIRLMQNMYKKLWTVILSIIFRGQNCEISKSRFPAGFMVVDEFSLHAKLYHKTFYIGLLILVCTHMRRYGEKYLNTLERFWSSPGPFQVISTIVDHSTTNFLLCFHYKHIFCDFWFSLTTRNTFPRITNGQTEMGKITQIIA